MQPLIWKEKDGQQWSIAVGLSSVWTNVILDEPDVGGREERLTRRQEMNEVQVVPLQYYLAGLGKG